MGIAVDPGGSAYVTGTTSSADFPTSAGAFQPTFGGSDGPDAFVTKLELAPTALTVLVDSSSHLYELKQLLLAGLQQQLLLACNAAGLRKITLKPGRWYEGDAPDGRKPRFG